MRMLAACESSGRVRDAFAARGWDAWSCDLEPSESSPRFTFKSEGIVRTVTDYGAPANTSHYQGDVRNLFNDAHACNSRRLAEWETTPGMPGMWDLVIAFPPCDHLALAGARWWKAKQADGRQQAAAGFFMEMVMAPAPHVAVENPRGWMTRAYRKPDQVVEPFWFGDPYAKATCLWLKNLPLLSADNLVTPAGRVATGGGSWRTDKAAERSAMNLYEDSEGRANRATVRGRTFPGFARAMADRWGSWLEEQEAA